MHKLYHREKLADNLIIVRCFSFLSPHSSMLSRFLENISFGVTSGWAILMSKHPTVIYANTWPIFATGILAGVARLRHIPVVMSIQDVYPESLSAQGRIRESDWLARLLRWLDGRIVGSVKTVVVPAPSFKHIYQQTRGVSPHRICLVYNWFDVQSVVPDAGKGGWFRAKLKIPDTATVVLYGGNIGAGAGVETVLDKLGQLMDLLNAYLVIAGDGSSLSACREKASQIGNPRILFYSPWPPDETTAALSAADVLVLPTRGKQSLVSIPSKLITYLLAGQPIIALAQRDSDLATLLTQSSGGWWIEPDQPAALAAAIQRAIRLTSVERTRIGQSGRRFALENFSQATCLPRIIELIEQADRDSR